MIIFVPRREPYPNMPHWPGRRFFAALDAVGWPAAVAYGVTHIPLPVGVVGAVVLALCALSGALRFSRAVLASHRYRFTTSWVARAVLVLTSLGVMVRLI
jgi:hypothetical protein